MRCQKDRSLMALLFFAARNFIASGAKATAAFVLIPYCVSRANLWVAGQLGPLYSVDIEVDLPPLRPQLNRDDVQTP
jgi:hypothetical protein